MSYMVSLAHFACLDIAQGAAFLPLIQISHSRGKARRLQFYSLTLTETACFLVILQIEIESLASGVWVGYSLQTEERACAGPDIVPIRHADTLLGINAKNLIQKLRKVRGISGRTTSPEGLTLRLGTSCVRLYQHPILAAGATITRSLLRSFTVFDTSGTTPLCMEYQYSKP
ncbi:hypothetical protein RRG08_002297 [Elysia crispata]|uniref:Uncharacterized protein n=1 Tax=Elysia crispata TaxID=231223 RepID=A0AAE0ZBC8_9GAST|nr:hypothetical protein RRG08_002297 [Elysia crispata]